MAKAIAGENYSVRQNDKIRSLSAQAYGYDKSEDIVDANSSLLAGRPISLEGLPTIYDGDTLFIPLDDSLITDDVEEIPADDPEEVAIRINGTIFRGWTANNVKRSINTVADSFSFTAPYNPDEDNSKFLDPHTFYPCDIFIGGKLYIAGRIDKVTPNPSGGDISIECRSLSAIIVDCPSTDKKLVYYKQTISQISDLILKPFGVVAKFPDVEAAKSKFPQVKRGTQDKVFSFLQGLARRVGFVINSTRAGNIQFVKANFEGEPIMSLIEGEQPQVTVSASYDSTQRFSDFTAITQARGKAGISATEKDESVPILRPHIFTAKDTTQGNISTAARWERSRSLSKSSTVSATVQTWKDGKGQIIRENETVTLLAPRACIFTESKFLIQDVTLSESDQGRQATLTLVMVESYTTVFPKVFPWSR